MPWKDNHEPTSGSFEVEREGQVAHLDYTVEGNVIALLHPKFRTNSAVKAWDRNSRNRRSTRLVITTRE